MRRLEDGELDLSYSDLRQADLSGRDLRRRNLSNCRFDRANFADADVSGATFINSILPNINFSRAVCHETVFGPSVVGCQFVEADLSRATFKGAILQGARFDNANITGADFSGAHLNDADFSGVIFDDTTLFNEAYGLRSVGRHPMLANYEFRDGRFYVKQTIVSAVGSTRPAAAAEYRIELGDVSARHTRISVESVAERLSANPEVSAALAASVASEIRSKISELEAQKPNDPETLNGWEVTTSILKETSNKLEAISGELNAAKDAPSPAEKQDRLKRAAKIAVAIYDEMLNWFESNPKNVGSVLAQMTVAASISGALGYLVGAPVAFVGFGVVVAGLNNVNLWQAIKELGKQPQK